MTNHENPIVSGLSGPMHAENGLRRRDTGTIGGQSVTQSKSGERLELRSPAKINLFLAVHGKRTDGYHELSSLMCCVDLWDEITCVFQGTGIRVTCDELSVPQDEGNLAAKAAATFMAHAGVPQFGLRMRIQKRIPVGAGLGGGSSNAAIVLRGLNHYFGQPLPASRLLQLAATLGSDVPFFLDPVPAIATGRGEKLSKFEYLSPFPVILVNPGFSISTAWVYGNLKLGLTNCEQKLKKIPLNGRAFDPAHQLCNDLESVMESVYPEIGFIKAMLLEAGAAGALMSGSGSTVFGVFNDPDKAAEAFSFVQEEIRVRPGWRCWLSRLITEPIWGFPPMHEA
ncbi:4-(cytidine 5'-diphospho)-2-C-methyl-D-erythritol kinase [Desulfatirhabdium butyrativorans]|uniref:4-(cytidine 5'-diphospho)-2-C-methyl-D-erythritol kinase n=1 Tax=Desulfatirhabdium butyrativorans TaxID=340467 RepID=UPI0004123457|nr:4-(cytidine 5'-diphospho)-2-C-methyl-D-erythritol kinase [Desulfatirhabdium butyrativorans]